MLNFQIMKDLDVPVIFDATHSLQLPGGLGNAAGGRREYLLPLAKAGLSQCIAGLFIEAHPDPDSAKCDGPCAISTAEIPPVLSQLCELDDFIKNQDSDL
jgi:2-dehydro-3-deoxyphosphooctonate aldolase (KDO 8-P synthase)